MISVEFAIGRHETFFRDMPAVPRIGEMVTVYGDDVPEDVGKSSFRVMDVWWTLTSDSLQKRVLVMVMLT